jgi:hypothetical protein
MNLQDADELTYQVRLRVTIEGNGITLTTRNNINFAPLELTYGSPSIFREMDLQQYFDPASFDFVGYSLNDYLNNGGLPDGFYTICIETLDYLLQNEGPVSQKTCTVINASQLDPPVIQAPIGNLSNIVDPQNLAVSWLNMHNVPIPVEHELEIFTWPYASSLTPEQVVQFDLPFFTTTLMSTTTYVITPADPPLQAGERYLIRVRAQDMSMNYLFKNQGWSEIQVFAYGDACPGPSGLASDSVSTESINLTWLAPNNDFNAYNVRYREKIDGAHWYEDESQLTEYTIEGLEDNTVYEIQVQTLCGGVNPGLLSNIIEVKTDSFIFDPTTFECGDDALFPEITNMNPISSSQISPGDWITVGGFQAKITAIGPGNISGTFNGSCQVKIDWLGYSFNAKFKNLFINDERVVFDGNIICSTRGLRSLAGFVPPDSVEVMQEAGTALCGDTIFADTSTIAGTFNANAYDMLIPNGTRDAYNPYNKVAPYDPLDYSPPNPYTEQNPYDEESEWNPHNTFNPYDPFDYSDPANPYTQSDPYVAGNMYRRTSTSIPGGILDGAKTLPFGLTSQGLNGQDYMIAMDKMAFTTNGAIMNAYISLPIPKPGGGQQFASFMMRGIRFHTGGLIGINKLVLTSDISFKLGPKAVVTFEGGKQSFVSFDCHGFTGVSIKGKVEMCRDILVPIDWSGHGLDTNGYVTGYFYATMPEWGEFVADLSITPFEVPGLEDWAFVVENAVFDFSDAITPASVKFPKNYVHPDVTGIKGNLNPAWTGFYMKALRVRLPKRFNKGTPSDTTQADTSGQVPLDPNNMDSLAIAELNERVYDDNQIEIGVEGVIIDDTGVTLYVYGSNLLTLEEGRVGPWGFAIDSVGVGIQSNEFKNGYLKGKVDIPALGTPLSYSVVVAPATEYTMTVAIDSSITINAFAASVTLTGGSSVTVQYLERTKRWDGICNLNGIATINANMNTDTSANADTTSRLQLPGLQFESLQFMTKAPYVNIGNWALTGDDQGGASNFPLMINQMGVFQSRDNKRVAFIIDAALNLKPTNDSNNGEGNGFSAYGKLGVISKIITDPVTERQDWEFERVRVDEFGLEVSAPGFKLKGEIMFYENVHLYGTGFRASILVEVQPAISLEAVAQFGEVDGFRYFFVDAFLGVNPGIPLGPTGMAIYGFGGGISYKMKRTGYNDMVLPETNDTPDETNEPIVFEGHDPDAGGEMPRPAESWFDPTKGRNLKPLPQGTDPNIVPPDQRLGLSVSGMRYVPDVNSGIGIKVMLAAGAVKREVFYGKVTLEILFTASGGLQSVGFMGDLSFMTPPTTSGKPGNDPALRATIDMLYDNTPGNETFYAKLGIYVSVYGGAISGAYPQNLAGHGRIFANKDDWYVHIGTPTKPVKIALDITAMSENLKDKNAGGAGTDSIPGEFQNDQSDSLDVAQGGVSVGNVGLLISAYLDFGTIIPDFPPLPQEVTDILGEGYNLTQLDDNTLGSGDGLLFGAKLAVEMRDLTFLFFYADFYAGIGFDLMMRDYGSTARCDGIQTDGPIGINGWYATGQLYAYMVGRVGLFFNIFGSEKKIEILEIGAAAVLQARLPNPIWMRGAIRGYFSVLNGLIKGDCKFEFELGEECIIIGSTSPATDFITDVTPDSSATNVNVFERPRVTFSLPLDEEFYWEDIDGHVNYYRASLNQFNVSLDNGGTWTPIQGDVSWNGDKTVLAFTPSDILPQNSSIKVDVSVLFETKRNYGSPWVPLLGNNNQVETDERSVTFTTGAAPRYIPESNIAYSYPVMNQMYFLKNESSGGYIQLKQGQPYLFESQPEFDLDPSEWNQKFVFTQNGQPTSTANINYSNKRVSFSMPVGELDNSTITSFALLNIPVNAAAAIDADLDSILIAYAADPGIPDSLLEGVSAEIKQNKLNSNSVEQKVTTIFKAGFRTSMHNSWAEKVAAIDLSDNYTWPVLIDPIVGSSESQNQSSIDEFGAQFRADRAPERFDKAETNGYWATVSPGVEQWIQPLVSPEAILTSTPNNWFGEIQSTLYDHVPNNDIILERKNRSNREIIGVPPSKAVIAVAQNGGQELSADNIEYNFVDILDKINNIQYHVPYETILDFDELRQKVVAEYYQVPSPPAWSTTLFNWDFPYPVFGQYGIKLNYQLPGASVPSSSINKTVTYAYD